MMSTLCPTQSPISAEAIGTSRSDTIDFRSRMIGRVAARTEEIPRNVVCHLLAPHMPNALDSSTKTVAALIGELILASKKNEVLAHANSTESDQSIGYSIAASLQWLFEMEPDFGEAVRARMVLKSLMPLYLAAGQGRAGTSIRDTLTLIRSACMLPQLNRLTTDGELSTWIQEADRADTDPIEAISKAFRVDLALMANSFWKEARSMKSERSDFSGRGIDVSIVSNEKHRAWWSLAGQLYAQRAQINIPADLAVGVIAWDRLLDHWQRLTKSIASRTESNRNEEIAAYSVAAKSNEAQGSSIANDHRFVEIRSARDPQLSSNLEQMLQHCRSEQGTMALVVAKRIAQDSASAQHFQNWQSLFIEYMDVHGESTNVRGFISGDGELSLVFQDVDRAELGQWIRDSFAKINNAKEDSSLATTVTLPLVAGVAMVSAPSRTFKIDQLIQSAWRCLDGASKQGAGAVKTIEVY
jgi:hypothetical protein